MGVIVYKNLVPGGNGSVKAEYPHGVIENEAVYQNLKARIGTARQDRIHKAFDTVDEYEDWEKARRAARRARTGRPASRRQTVNDGRYAELKARMAEMEELVKSTAERAAEAEAQAKAAAEAHAKREAELTAEAEAAAKKAADLEAKAKASEAKAVEAKKSEPAPEPEAKK
jgi:colicin import membrane protein